MGCPHVHGKCQNMFLRTNDNKYVGRKWQDKALTL